MLTAQEIANKYRTSPVIQGLLKEKYIQAIKVIRDETACGLVQAREAVMILRGGSDAPLMLTEAEVRELIVRNAIDRLTLTEVERQAFRAKGLIQ